jgi:hypothetical protein
MNSVHRRKKSKRSTDISAVPAIIVDSLLERIREKKREREREKNGLSLVVV